MSSSQTGDKSGGSDGQKKIAKFQLKPAPVDIGSSYRGVSAACGEAHALLLTDAGDVLVWGQNSCGQLGSGPNASGFLVDLDRPAAVIPFAHNPNSADLDFHGPAYSPSLKQEFSPVRAVSVCAGSFHSCVIDSNLCVWTWGARGNACLGHSDALVLGTDSWNDRIMNNHLFHPATATATTSAGSLKIMVPYELMHWVSSWSRPRLVEASIGLHVISVAAGDMHTAMLTKSGQVLLCGSGAVVPPYLSAETVQKYSGGESEQDWEGEDDEGGVSRKASRQQKPMTEDRVKEMMSEALVVSAPRRPSASWLSTLTQKSTLYIACGGSHMLALQDCESIAVSLMQPLLKKAMHGQPTHDNTDNADTGDEDNRSLLSAQSHYSDSSYLSFFEKRGKVDCLLIAGGKVLLCHKAILCQRSSELRDMIEAELPVDEDIDSNSLNSSQQSQLRSEQQPVQILLPQLTVDAARALVVYLYTDLIPRSVVTDVSTLHSLAKVGESLRMPRLQLLCEGYLRALSEFKELVNGDDADDPDASPEAFLFALPKPSIEIPPSTLSRDLGALVGDKQFADVRFIAEGRAISAHRFILESRSEYFRAMFRSGQTAESARNATGKRGLPSRVVDVIVPGN
jgi:hypothetical protein